MVATERRSRPELPDPRRALTQTLFRRKQTLTLTLALTLTLTLLREEIELDEFGTPKELSTSGISVEADRPNPTQSPLTPTLLEVDRPTKTDVMVYDMYAADPPPRDSEQGPPHRPPHRPPSMGEVPPVITPKKRVVTNMVMI